MPTIFRQLRVGDESAPLNRVNRLDEHFDGSAISTISSIVALPIS
jgi:hypothetical protein